MLCFASSIWKLPSWDRFTSHHFHHLWKVSTGTLRLSILAFSSPGEKDCKEKERVGIYHVLFCSLQGYPSAASTWTIAHVFEIFNKMQKKLATKRWPLEPGVCPPHPRPFNHSQNVTHIHQTSVGMPRKKRCKALQNRTNLNTCMQAKEKMKVRVKVKIWIFSSESESESESGTPVHGEKISSSSCIRDTRQPGENKG